MQIFKAKLCRDQEGKEEEKTEEKKRADTFSLEAYYYFYSLDSNSVQVCHRCYLI